MKKKVIGIYKITSPSGNAYIGQSNDIYARWRGHKSIKSSRCIFLKRSISKYGIVNHSFEIIHELPDDVSQAILNEYECLYIDLYKSCGVALMNIKEGGSNGKHSEETKKLFSIQRKGKTTTLGRVFKPRT